MFGFGFGPRRGGGGFFFFIILLMFLGPGVFLLPIFELAIYVGLGVIAFKGIQKLVNVIKEKSTSSPKSSINRKTKPNNMSNAEYSRIDKKLTAYFKKNVSLPIVDEIALVTSNGKYISIDELFVSYKDEKVIKLAEFKEEHYGMYEKIVSMLNEFSKKPESFMASKVETPEVKKEDVLSDAQKYIDRINDLNAQIPQVEITNGLYQTCDLLKKIDLTKQSKIDEKKLTKLYDYYLPILTGILENYKGLQNGVKDEEFNKCEAQLIKTIMLINQALKTLYGEMHEDDYLNINADIDTLQTLLKKDGFSEDPFSNKE